SAGVGRATAREFAKRGTYNLRTRGCSARDCTGGLSPSARSHGGRINGQGDSGKQSFPGWMDRYLAHFGYDGQQTEEPGGPNRPNNLWHPLAADHGAHGRFDSRSRRWSFQWLANTHRVFLGAVGIAAGLALFAGQKERGPKPATTRRPERAHIAVG